MEKKEMTTEPLPIDEWPISKRTKEKVKAELNKWLQMLIDYADGREGNVYRYDIIKKDTFFFTDCRDIVKRNLEGIGDEVNLDIRRRKRYVVMQLLLKQIMSGPIKRIIKCTHCGSENVYIDSMINGGGHFKFCPECGKTDFSTYPAYYESAIESVINVLKVKGLIDEKKSSEKENK